MSEAANSNFNNIIDKIIKKSLFTNRQIQIILNHKNLSEFNFTISKGAYFRQVSQSREKLVGLFYSVILLRSLGVLLPDDLDVISRLAEQVSVIKDSDVTPEQEEQVINVIEKLVRQTCGM